MNQPLLSRSPLLLLLAACATSQGSGTGAMLSVDYFGDTDVVGFHFEVERVPCAAGDAFEPLLIAENVDLVDGIFPGQIALVEQSLDPDSRHLASDFFVALPAGCYDVTATPASSIDGADWLPSADCSSADFEGAQVVDGQTTDIVLISQCNGDPSGSLDTLVLLNHPPQVSVDLGQDTDGDGVPDIGEDLDGDGFPDAGGDEKFAYECEPVVYCATATDVDDDPLEFVWSQAQGAAPFAFNVGELEVIGFEEGHRVWQQCATIIAESAGDYDFTVTVYDLGYSNGNQVRIETLVSPEDSNDSQTVPV